jgi:trimethylamine:corrinoid methyltransferase-like protein
MNDKYRLQIPRLKVISDAEIELIHLSTLEVLRRTGIAVREPKAVEILEKAGCAAEGDRVRIPAHLVEQALRATPPRVAMSDRNGKPAMFLEADNVYFGTGSDTPHISDLQTKKRRLAVLKDIENVARVVDFLPELNFLMCSGIASDVNPRISDIFHFEAMVGHTEKPIVFTAWSLNNLKAIIRMAEAVAGGAAELRTRPFVALYTEPISPLTLAAESTQKLMFMAEKGLPVVFTPGLLTGGTGPVTTAGGLVQANAEMLGGYVLARAIREGTPFIYGGGVFPIDMATGLLRYAAPEGMLATSALTDMARHYRLPMFSFAGCSDSSIYDEQAAIEGALWTLLSSLSGGNLVHDVGYINNGLTTSYEQLVVSNEVISMVRRITGGIKINEETLALDLIDKVGPGGEYLTSEHTLKHFKENWQPQVFSRSSYERWEKEGKKDLAARANGKAGEILKTHAPRPLDGRLQTELRKIVKSMDK